LFKQELGSKTPLNVKSNKTPILKQYINHFDLILLFLPGLALLILFKYVPMYGILIAFKDYRIMDGVMASPWVGFDHFIRLFKGNDFLVVLKNTLTISLLKLIIGFPAPIMLALMLNEVRSTKFKKIVQTFSYLPHFFSWVVLGGIMIMIFSTEGPVNILLRFFGANQAIQFFGEPVKFIILLILSSVWQSIGWGSIVYLATISSIDESMYEAAYIDGAGRWKQTLYITLPSLIPTIITLFILNLGHVLDAGFDQIYNLYNPTVYSVADILDTFVLRRLQKGDYSFGTAIGLFKSVVGLVLISIVNWISDKMSDGENGIW
jgi:putative aldouronate transport system permease protein